MTDWIIRDAVAADALPIATLMTELGYTTTEAEMRTRLSTIGADSNFRTLVAATDTAVVGVAGVGIAPFYERNGTYGRLLALAVTEAYRSSGIGRVLVEAAEAWLIERGATAIVVGTGHHRRRAHRFYERAGYKSTGIRYVKELAPLV